jgi:hypothetical protein
MDPAPVAPRGVFRVGAPVRVAARLEQPIMCLVRLHSGLLE